MPKQERIQETKQRALRLVLNQMFHTGHKMLACHKNMCVKKTVACSVCSDGKCILLARINNTGIFNMKKY